MSRLHVPALVALLALSSPSVAPAAVLHAWHADGNATDAVGDADGTFAGDTGFVDSLFGEGFSFDGDGDEVTFGTTAGNFGTSDFTIAFVIRSTNTTAVEGVLAKREQCTYGSFWDIRSSPEGLLSLELYETNVPLGVSTHTPINDGLFHTVVFTRQGNLLLAYVDGFVDGDDTHESVANVSNDAQLTAGGGACVGLDGTVRFGGLLDEIRLADHADSTLLPAFFHCGDANRNANVTASDALDALQTSVQSESCDPCLCNANGIGGITASDALLILRRAVAQSVAFQCPLCTAELPPLDGNTPAP